MGNTWSYIKIFVYYENLEIPFFNEYNTLKPILSSGDICEVLLHG